MKSNLLHKILNLENLFSLIFGALVFVFFALYYPFHLHYQEQYQLFLYTPGYFFDFFSHPGGIADYLGNFFTQFFFYAKIGAFLLACILTFLQRLVYVAAKKIGSNSHWMPLTFLPPFLYWSLLNDENYLLGGVISILLLALFINIYLLFGGKRIQPFAGLILLVCLYWFAGGVFILFSLFILTARFFIKKPMAKTDVIAALGVFIVTLLLPLVTKLVVLQYPMIKFWIGVTYFRFPVNIPFPIAIIALSVFALPFLMVVLSKTIRWKKSRLILIALTIVLAIFGFGLIHKSADFTKEEVMAYDFHVRMRKWDRAIELADKKAPSSPLAVTCLNLALAKQDLLGEKMFSYYQKGMGGLIPDFTRDFTIPMIAGEVYYHLGLVNTAQRFAFEAMEALPNYQKSVRAVKRLAETNIINGEYDLARKYLHLLQKTFYYQGWATQALETIKDEKKVEAHVEWGWLRKARIQEDFLFSEQEKENMLGLLFTHNPENRMPFEYLLASSLVKKDLQSFINYYPLSKSLNYKVIPKNFQEALIYIWGITNSDPTRKIPYPISNSVIQQFDSYKSQYGRTKNAAVLQKNFGDTYWYYFHFQN